MTYTEQMQRIWKEYEKAGMHMPATTKDVAAWAIHQKLWQPQPADIIRQCAEDLSVALRAEYRTDELGRHYRSKHAIRISSGGIQQTLWADIDKASRSHMQIAFGQRRNAIVADCHQLKIDVDYYNHAHSKHEPIQLILDFTMDIKEMESLEKDAVAA